MRAVPTRQPVQNPLEPARFFRTGTVARFLPPPGAYSAQSEQSRQRGNSCLVVRCWNDSHATITFGQGAPLVVSLDYLWETP